MKEFVQNLLFSPWPWPQNTLENKSESLRWECPKKAQRRIPRTGKLLPKHGPGPRASLRISMSACQILELILSSLACTGAFLSLIVYSLSPEHLSTPGAIQSSFFKSFSSGKMALSQWPHKVGPPRTVTLNTSGQNPWSHLDEWWHYTEKHSLYANLRAETKF